MSPNTPARRFVVPLLVLGTIFLLAGCVAVPGDDGLETDLEQRFASEGPPDEIAATLEVRSSIDGETTVREENVWYRTDGTSRVESTDGTHVVVVDGQSRWSHDSETGSVQRLEIDPNQPSILDGLYTQQTRYVESDRYTLTEREETTIEGRETYRLVFDPPENETVERSVDVLVGDTEYVIPLETSERDIEDRGIERIEIWLDKETLFPVRHHLDGDEIELETTYRNLAVEPGLEDDLFEFDPSTVSGIGDGENGETSEDDAVEEIALPVIDHHETVEAATEAVPFAVAEPDRSSLPETVERDGIRSYEFPDENRTQVSLFYRDEDGTVSVTTSDGPREFAADGTEITVETATGRIEETDQGTELEWSCDGRHYSVFAADSFADGTALEIAESTAAENCS
ncbi:outer membrane lipoprotein carrier protein LolA [Natrarchaeobius halalkaliphilus]|uniref:Outer membrane lipoprotein carrier protein LolA n=1 Tax=Natrarchaeobius halalkaliphilus TaxID=1679091 RepID=A0A3N6LII3_9EURY|nr:outer membrane lipoprotein carrier protein LolA [Natrarchaeobius halalkaliphilus]RQG87009.1 outer membrane lipoprotein carrier protein LolA [Natrarchaeobius halalkaliphilus]